MNTLLKQTLTASVLSTMLASAAFAAPTETPPDFVKRVADGLVKRLKADHAKLQNNPELVRTIIRQNLDPYVDSQAFTRIVLGTYANNQHTTAAQRAQFEKNFREVIIENYGSAFAKYTNQSYTMRPYRATNSKNPVVTLDFLNNGEKIPVSFQLVDKGDQWRIRNVNVAGIDLGLQFRNQFAATVQRNGGDINKAIATFKPDADAAVTKK
ncbi:ABC transporter substrate-binding protein [Acinetobacter haemolyticus]|uniref:MlaC/ttg2D family ABC transporter substrate-binding protein n=1 Tax=Acinetobacter haemolyticus TaxID=29430 RepID=UPI000AEF8D7F|nr:ABC transporter substrate-binding protein [Acinetobacter haemolyticus]NAR46920.1 ABC transporter substrate-binding protein [Acinetobacter haemolyticus]NAR49761.1 ABC transporter substrate-binding protein [Acinetobacter haemolyticus]NAR53065.1 ABC transporter substrate-binding protein [Acinetobacter haemolyticus]NCU23959.1 ABC transporter substrate-binding protein [Acinetobacter haemolyticus]QHI25111.1 ABC transporter substrate-binding protein [Acinetobacter haemolyticus]